MSVSFLTSPTGLNVGILELEDAETGESILVDCSDSVVRSSYLQLAQAGMAKLDGQFRAFGIDTIKVSTDTSYVESLMEFFKMRAQKIRV